MGSMADFGWKAQKRFTSPKGAPLPPFLPRHHHNERYALGITPRETHARFFPGSLLSCAPLRPRATRSAWPEHGERQSPVRARPCTGLSTTTRPRRRRRGSEKLATRVHVRFAEADHTGGGRAIRIVAPQWALPFHPFGHLRPSHLPPESRSTTFQRRAPGDCVQHGQWSTTGLFV